MPVFSHHSDGPRMTGDECLCEWNLPLPIFITNYCIEYDEIKHQLLSLKPLCGLFWITSVLPWAGLASSCSVLHGFKMLFLKIGLFTPMAFRAVVLLLKGWVCLLIKMWLGKNMRCGTNYNKGPQSLSRPNTIQKSTENRRSTLVPNRKINPKRILIGIKVS